MAFTFPQQAIVKSHQKLGKQNKANFKTQGTENIGAKRNYEIL